jgi:UDP-glucose 4-epimerase
MAGKLTLPLVGPLFSPVTSAGRRFGLADFSPDFSRLLRYGRAVDTQRLVEEVGFEPRFDAVEAVEDYVRHQGGRRLVPTARRAVAR